MNEPASPLAAAVDRVRQLMAAALADHQDHDVAPCVHVEDLETALAGADKETTQ